MRLTTDDARSLATLSMLLAALTYGNVARAQDAGAADASAADASRPTGSIAIASDVAAAFPLDVSSRAAQRTVRNVRAAIITMTRCSSEYGYQRVIVYNTARCNAAWQVVDPTLSQPTFGAAIVAMLEAPTATEQQQMDSEAFATHTWTVLLRELTQRADAGSLPQHFVPFALRAIAAKPSASPTDFVVRDLHHLLDRAWGYDPSPVAPWGDASGALGTRAEREARVRRLSEFAMSHRARPARAREQWSIEQSRRDLTSSDLTVRWRALQRLLRRRSMREVHREATANLQALWRDRASLPADARSHINAQISQHLAYWNLPQDSHGNFSFEPRR